MITAIFKNRPPTGDLLNEFAVIYLFIIIPQGYLPCAKLFMILDESFILISSDCVSFF